MATVTIKNLSGFDAKVKIGDQAPKLATKEKGTTFDNVTGKVIFQATPLGTTVGLKASVPWTYNPLHNIVIALKIDDNTAQFFFDPGSIL